MLGGDVGTRICKRRQENKLESALTDQYKMMVQGRAKETLWIDLFAMLQVLGSSRK